MGWTNAFDPLTSRKERERESPFRYRSIWYGREREREGSVFHSLRLELELELEHALFAQERERVWTVSLFRASHWTDKEEEECWFSHCTQFSDQNEPVPNCPSLFVNGTIACHWPLTCFGHARVRELAKSVLSLMVALADDDDKWNGYQK